MLADQAVSFHRYTIHGFPHFARMAELPGLLLVRKSGADELPPPLEGVDSDSDSSDDDDEPAEPVKKRAGREVTRLTITDDQKDLIREYLVRHNEFANYISAGVFPPRIAAQTGHIGKQWRSKRKDFKYAGSKYEIVREAGEQVLYYIDDDGQRLRVFRDFHEVSLRATSRHDSSFSYE
jgi:hypothetical protein